MGFLDRLLSRFEARAANASSNLGSAFYAGPTAAGQAITARTAENHAAVLACVSAISSAIALIEVDITYFLDRAEQKGRKGNRP